MDTDTRNLIGRSDDRITKFTTFCMHPSFKKNICRTCGQEVQNLSHTYVSFNYIEEDLKYSRIEVGLLKDRNTEHMLSQNKLHLVLDLENTLIHTIPTKDYERYLLENQGDVSIVEKTYVGSHEMVTKISPFVKEFLEAASTMFEMYVYTTRDRDYAKAMTRLLDPEGVYFGSRIICREDCIQPGLKSLELVLGYEDATLIVDHAKDVWPDDEMNLILIQKYCYFDSGSGRGKQCCYSRMLKKDDSKEDRALRNVLVLLKKVHTEFFKEQHNSKKSILQVDVRRILKEVRGLCNETITSY